MKIYHWKSQGIDAMVLAGSEVEARAQLVSDFKAWRWQDPTRFDLMLHDLAGPPLFVAGPLHTITIDSLERRAQA